METSKKVKFLKTKKGAMTGMIIALLGFSFFHFFVGPKADPDAVANCEAEISAQKIELGFDCNDPNTAFRYSDDFETMGAMAISEAYAKNNQRETISGIKYFFLGFFVVTFFEFLFKRKNKK